MRILIELPTWLGDSVMASSAIENLVMNYQNAKIVFFGSVAATGLYDEHKNTEKIVIDDSKNGKFRLVRLVNLAKNLGEFDLALSFRSSFFSKIFLHFVRAKMKFGFKKSSKFPHQVQKYENFVKKSLNLTTTYDALKLYFEPKKFEKFTIGINPGATYGSAKRWYPEYFASVCDKFKKDDEILLFGGKNESEICSQIYEILQKNGKNVVNLCGKTSIKELCQNIAGLDFFITNDSGPMHIAAAFDVKMVAIFGPTSWAETSPYSQNSKLAHLNLPCQPCKKRVCPLKTHDCMKNLTPKIVMDKIDLSIEVVK